MSIPRGRHAGRGVGLAKKLQAQGCSTDGAVRRPGQPCSELPRRAQKQCGLISPSPTRTRLISFSSSTQVTIPTLSSTPC
jgi:hypothetical protein